MQTSYSINQAAAQGGGLYDMGPNDIVSAVDPTEVVPYGVALCRGVADSECKLPSSSGDVAKIIGVSVLSHTNEQALGTNISNYPMGKDIPLLRKGRMWVKVEESVTAGSPVFVRFASGAGGSQLGAFRTSADTASAAQVMGAVFAGSAAAGGVAIVELNLPA